MRYKTFDTHKYIKELEASGFREAQAEVIINSLLASRDFDLSTLATREQFGHLQADVSLIKKDISILDNKISTLDEKMSDKITDVKVDISGLEKKMDDKIVGVKADISNLEKRMDDKISALENKIDTKISERIASLESKILRWGAPILIGGFGAIISMLAKMMH